MPSKRTFRKRTPKARMERWHAIKRARERYGLELTVADLERMAADFVERRLDAELVERQSCRCSVYDCTLRTERGGAVAFTAVRFVWDSLRKAVVSFLPRGEPVRHG